MRAVKMPAKVNKDHTLRLELPHEIGEGPAEVIVLLPEAGEGGRSIGRGECLDDFLARDQAPELVRSKRALDAAVARQRRSWE